MQSSIFIFKFKILKKEISFLTKVVLVNWFVAFVNCTNDDDCNSILFDIVIARFVVNVIKYSRTFAREFNSLLNSIKAVSFNGTDVYLKTKYFR
jgi:hypothetical protein